MSMTAVALSSFLPMWQHRHEAVLALLRGEPGQQVANRFRMARSDLYKFRARALQAVRLALRDQPRGPKRPHNRLAADREQAVVKSLQQHPTLSARQLQVHLGEVAPHSRTIDRIRHRHGLNRALGHCRLLVCNVSRPNAGAHLLPEAAATQERRL